MKFTPFTLVKITSVITLAILVAVWWMNGRDDTWFYVIAGIIVLTSLFSAKPQKKDDDR